jgi:hypothetical protein
MGKLRVDNENRDFLANKAAAHEEDAISSTFVLTIFALPPYRFGADWIRPSGS